VLKVLATPYRTEEGEIIKGASGILYAEELTSFLVKDPNTVDNLTDLYDYHEHWQTTLSVAGVSELHKVCLSLLGASNDALIRDLYDKRAAEGGLLARTCLIAEGKRRHLNSLENIDGHLTAINDDECIQILKAISTLRGNFEREHEAKLEFENWYNSMTDDKYSQSGVEARIHDTVRKLSMIVCASESRDKLIKKKHVERAIDECTSLLKNYRVISAGTGTSQIAKPGASFIRELLLAPEFTLTRRKVLQRLLGDLDAETFEKIIETYGQAGLINVTFTSTNEQQFQLTQKALEMLGEG